MGHLKYNGGPIGLGIFTSAGGEATLLKVMSAWENTFHEREVPQSMKG